jgi:hypothetical protein
MQEGPYKAQLILGNYADEALCPGAGRRGMLEPFIIRRLERALKKRPPEPVAALDSGGGIGLSWLRLARRFQQEVRDERLLLVVSSLHANPETFLDTAQYSLDEMVGGVLPDPAEVHEAKRLFEKYGERVLYTATHPAAKGVAMMSRLAISSMDIVHERRGGVGWSRVPESHILRTASSVALNGIFMIHTTDIGQAHGLMHDDQERDVRRNGVVEAGRTLITPQYGLTMTNNVQTGKAVGRPLDYAVFSGPRAEPIAV